MVALDLNPPVKHAGLVPVRLPVILGKLINKTLTTDNWHREHNDAGLVPVRLGKFNKTLING